MAPKIKFISSEKAKQFSHKTHNTISVVLNKAFASIHHSLKNALIHQIIDLCLFCMMPTFEEHSR